MRPDARVALQTQAPADFAEAARLEALDRYDVLDTPREEGFDALVRLIRNIFQVPVGIVSVIDGHRQWYKAWEGLPSNEVPREETLCETVIRTGEPMIIEDVSRDPRFASNPHVMGEPKVRFYAGVPLLTREGHPIGTLCAIDFRPRPFTVRERDILVDLARIAMAEFELRRFVAVDVLTGVLSRRTFREEAVGALGLARRHNLDLACIAFDIDHFKSINDHHGHAFGDRVLESVGKIASSSLRGSDLIGRIGGEEFAVILPHTDKRGAAEVAQRLREAIATHHFEVNGVPKSVTASFGIAFFDDQVEGLDTLMARADEALYAAKSQGRNRCIFWHDQNELRHSRRRVLKAGHIVFNERKSTIDCTVRSLSDTGAGFDLASSYGLPARFNLLIRSEGIDRRCRVTEQSQRHVEVEFI